MIKNILKRYLIAAGILCGFLALALIGQYAQAQGAAADPEQAA